MSSPASWTVRPYAPGDEHRATRLFEEVFGKPMTPEHYRWKFRHEDWAAALPNVWLAESGDRIVGQYAGTPMRFRLGGAVVGALHGCDVMTAPDFRRRGVLTALGAAAAEAWAAAGIAVVTGLHYGGWGTRRHHLGWREQFPTQHVQLGLRPERLLLRYGFGPNFATRLLAAGGRAWRRIALRSLRSGASEVTVQEVSMPGPEFDHLWNRLADGYDAMVVRDRAWLRYRYAEAPHAAYRLFLARRGGEPTGYIATRTLHAAHTASGLIVDLFAAPEDTETRKALFDAALAALDAEGVAVARGYVPARTPLNEEFRGWGFRRRRGRFDVSIIPLDPAADYTSLADPRRWFTMPGDFDVW